MRPSDDPELSDEDFPQAWQRDPRVRRAVVAALRPVGDVGLETRDALGRVLARVAEVSAQAAGRRVGGVHHGVHRGMRIHPGGRTGWMVGGLFMALILGVLLVMRSGSIGQPPRIHTYATAMGQRAEITLRDGSRVTLAPRTALRIDAGFGRTSRTVEVQGEAYFDVTNRSPLPFVVRAGNTHTRVLGTRFDVRRYNGDAETRVAVVSGKVTVGIASPGNDAVRPPSVVLAGGMVGRVTDSTATATTLGDVAPVTAWTDGRLVFHDTPVAEALRTLERWYGYRFTLASPGLGKQHLTATFDYGREDDMFSALKTLLDVTLSFDGRVVTVYPRGHTLLPAGMRRTVGDSMLRERTSEVGR